MTPNPPAVVVGSTSGGALQFVKNFTFDHGFSHDRPPPQLYIECSEGFVIDYRSANKCIGCTCYNTANGRSHSCSDFYGIWIIFGICSFCVLRCIIFAFSVLFNLLVSGIFSVINYIFHELMVFSANRWHSLLLLA